MEPLLGKLATSYFVGGLVSLATITNPVSKIPMFLAVAADLPAATARREARRACVYAFAILAGGLFAGVAVLDTFGISYGALRIAGGLTVAVLGYRMLFQHPERQPASPPASRRIAFFPLALPGIAGPGAIATVIGISTEIAELAGQVRLATAYAATVASIALTCLLMWGVLRSAGWVSARLGEEGINAVTRLTGFLLVCIGVQFIGSGLRTFLAGT
jgi:multiple antibiotic resistance protein